MLYYSFIPTLLSLLLNKIEANYGGSGERGKRKEGERKKNRKEKEIDGKGEG